MSSAAANERSTPDGRPRDPRTGGRRASADTGVRRNVARALPALAIAVAGVAVVCAAVGYFILRELDDRDLISQRQQLVAGIEQVRISGNELAASLAENLGSRPDFANASDLARTLVPPPALRARYNKAFVLDADGRLFAVFPDSTPAPAAIVRLAGELLGSPPIKTAPSGQEGRETLTDFVLIDATPAIGTVARIHRDETGAPSVALVTVTPFHAHVLADIGRVAGAEGLSVDAAAVGGARASLALNDRHGRIIGWLSWAPDRPVFDAARRLAPLLAIVAACFIAFAVMAIQLLRREAQSWRDVAAPSDADPLTRIAGRGRILEVLDRALAARAPDDIVLFATVNLDGFTEINDSFGYRVGDQLLISAAMRLREVTPPAAMVGRIGGDEFAIVMTVDDPVAAADVASTAMNRLSDPFSVGNQVVQIGACVGLALAPRDGDSRDEIVRRADLALRAAKRRGRGTVVGFDLAIEQEFHDRRFIMRALRNAIAEDALEVHYQPIVAAGTQRVLGVEALLRWRHRTRGEIPPEVFVPIAEQAGLMPQLGEFVLRRAIANAARWKNLFISINLSPLQVRDPRLVDLVGSILKHTSMAPGRVVLEITEGVLIDDPENAIKRLARLRALGVKIALDDFGSGYSSLRYLQRFPIDKLKIDMSFVAPLGQSESAGVIVQAIIALGRALNLVVLAEGVETEEQRILLRLAGCDEMQGHLFSKPLVASEVDALIAREARLAAQAAAPAGVAAR
jgi:diguanylate cyclase (GGDEF)-like protein